MASTGHDLSHKAGELSGQAQMKKEEFVNQASNVAQDASNMTSASADHNNPSYTSQATNFLQQTGEQVKSMAQGAATAVKNTLGMNPDNTNPSSNTTISTANQPSNPTPTKI
ncbi:late embryogenesis abundant protein 29-like [Tripterygium wilfordii]|uniref:late embryogenesis abundant protein 29-like n=1 Tax=Tripterygium wilfordii TaxID=458696 RepID=UPI0018F85F01|nr:late embryogenesis abundant protein 29-like [Tripterygium wilfordii]